MTHFPLLFPCSEQARRARAPAHGRDPAPGGADLGPSQNQFSGGGVGIFTRPAAIPVKLRVLVRSRSSTCRNRPRPGRNIRESTVQRSDNLGVTITDLNGMIRPVGHLSDLPMELHRAAPQTTQKICRSLRARYRRPIMGEPILHAVTDVKSPLHSKPPQNVQSLISSV